MEASGSSCSLATNRETIAFDQGFDQGFDQVSDEDPDPHSARGLGAITTAFRVGANVLMNLPGVTLA